MATIRKPGIYGNVKKFVRRCDQYLSKKLFIDFLETNRVSSFLFHSIFTDEEQIAKNIVDPQQGITLTKFKEFIEFYLDRNYTFTTPEAVIKSRNRFEKSILITFDDGYANNRLAIELLSEYQIPAVLYISLEHVLTNKNFWWDVIYRERKRQNISNEKIVKENLFLKTLKTKEIENYVMKEFGKKSLIPKGEIDRPFTPAEIRELCNNFLIEIGNHTYNHTILTNYDSEGIRFQIRKTQEGIKELIGRYPVSIAYPNGNYSVEVIEIAKEEGLKIGITTKENKSFRQMEFPSYQSLTMGRFLLWGNIPVVKQLNIYRESDLMIMEY